MKRISKIFGEQCLIGSVDYTRDKKFKFLTKNGKQQNKIKTKELFDKVFVLPVGEIILNSIDKDGTGNGFDYSILNLIPKKFLKPIIFLAVPVIIFIL